MLVGQFTKLFKSHAYRLFCYMIKLDGYEHKLRLLKEECQCVICVNDSPHKKFKMSNRTQITKEITQIENLKASLVMASSNISRLEYICVNQEHELKMLNEKLCDFRCIIDSVKDIRNQLDELRINVTELPPKQASFTYPSMPDMSLENRLIHLESVVKDTNEHHQIIQMMEKDMELLNTQVNELKEICASISQNSNNENQPCYLNHVRDIQIFTISTNSFQKCHNIEYEENITKNGSYIKGSYSNPVYPETASGHNNVTYEGDAESLANELSHAMLGTSLPSIEKPMPRLSSHGGIDKCDNSSSNDTLNEDFVDNDVCNDQCKMAVETLTNTADSPDDGLDNNPGTFNMSHSNDQKNFTNLDTYNLPQVEGNGSGLHVKCSDNTYVCSNPEDHIHVIQDQPRSYSCSSDNDMEKKLYSKTSTQETLRCSSSIDLIKSQNEWEETNDASSNQLLTNIISNCFSCCLTVWTVVFD